MSYVCTICEDQAQQVVMIATSLRDGSTLAMCEPCLPVGYVSALAVLTGTDPDRLFDAVSRFADREHAKAAKQAGEAQPGLDEQDGQDHAEDTGQP